jgi:transcription antitermination factor NusG
VPRGVVEALIAAADARGVLSGPPLEAGQTVRIIAGAFADQLAVIERSDEAGRVRVLLEIVTGTVAVTLDRAMLHETR